MSFLNGASDVAVTVIKIAEKTPLKEVLRGTISQLNFLVDKDKTALEKLKIRRNKATIQVSTKNNFNGNPEEQLLSALLGCGGQDTLNGLVSWDLTDNLAASNLSYDDLSKEFLESLLKDTAEYLVDFGIVTDLLEIMKALQISKNDSNRQSMENVQEKLSKIIALHFQTAFKALEEAKAGEQTMEDNLLEMVGEVTAHIQRRYPENN
jgi:hypothetical protein